MTRAKPTPSDPSMRATRVGDSPALPVTEPVQAPGGAPAPNSVRSREEGLGVKPAVVEHNLNRLDEWQKAALAEADGGVPDDGTGKDVHPDESAEAEAERQKREARNARRREQRAAKKAAAAKTTKKAAKK